MEKIQATANTTGKRNLVNQGLCQYGKLFGVHYCSRRATVTHLEAELSTRGLEVKETPMCQEDYDLAIESDAARAEFFAVHGRHPNSEREWAESLGLSEEILGRFSDRPYGTKDPKDDS